MLSVGEIQLRVSLAYELVRGDREGEGGFAGDKRRSGKRCNGEGR